MDISDCDLVVVGAGFFGATIAERAAREAGAKVVVLDKRGHIGGNSFSRLDEQTGIEIHPFGTHIFHTNSENVWRYIQRFTEFNDYRHRVFTISRGQAYSMPINLGTICTYFGRAMTPDEARNLIEREVQAQGIVSPKNLEEKAIHSIGHSLYKAFIEGYTWKQWQTDLRALPAEIITRLPVRLNFNDRYFSDKYEGIPLDGYGEVFRRMLTHPNIEVVLDTDYFDVVDLISPNALTVYTAPIDRFYGFQEGPLGWRTIDLEWQVVPTGDFQGTAVMNYADAEIPYTRIHEFRHLHPERSYDRDRSVIAREYSRFAAHGDEPYYPINTLEDKAKYQRYAQRARKEPRTMFGGRLGTYRYLDMHQAIGAALKMFEHKVRPYLLEPGKPLVLNEGEGEAEI
jgi:UDP-galactopyranose mutase